MNDWNALSRNEELEKAQTNSPDFIIIGGGITGAGVARELALRGLSFCLVDKADFAFGTSSRSSKLVHGGIRYLANKEFKIVRESTTERNWLRVHFPNLVRPLGFVLNAYENTSDSKSKAKIGTFLYDLLSDTFSKFKNYKKRKYYTPEEMEEIEPASRKDGLIMSAIYYDNNVDDGRLTLETIKEALVLSEESSTAVNYAEVIAYVRDEGDKIVGVKVKDQLNGEEVEIRATQMVINCTGIWTDELLELMDFDEELIRPTKGVHVEVPNDRVGNQHAFGLRSIDDGRFFFVLRRGDISVIGTTDTDYNEDLDTPVCTKEDCDYLFNTVNHQFPDANLTYDDIISTYAGIRPLVMERGKSESEISRKHEIVDTENGLITLTGGKLTIYRLMAEELLYYMVDREYIAPFPKKQAKKGYSKQPFLVGMTKENFEKEAKAAGLEDVVPKDQFEHFHMQYGTQGLEILKAIQETPEKGKPFLEGYPFCPAEIEFILAHENAPHLIDVMTRRTEIQLHVWHHKQQEIAAPIADIMAKTYGWSEEVKAQEMKEYMDYIASTIFF